VTYNIPLKEKNNIKPILNWENKDYAWFNINNLPENLHPGFKNNLNEILQIIAK